MVIRPATIADAHGIADVHVASWKAAYRGLMPDSVLDGLSVPKREEIWRRIVAEQKSELFVAEHNDKIVGLVNFGSARDPDVVPGLAGEILALYVAPRHWHKGIGRGLLQTALSKLKSAGFNKAIIWVLDSNSRARVFYEQGGFTADGAAKNGIVGDNVTIQEVRYRRSL